MGHDALHTTSILCKLFTGLIVVTVQCKRGTSAEEQQLSRHKAAPATIVLLRSLISYCGVYKTLQKNAEHLPENNVRCFSTLLAKHILQRENRNI